MSEEESSDSSEESADDSTFHLNIQVSSTKILTTKAKIKSDSKISQLKGLLAYEFPQFIPSNLQFDLEYNSQKINNNKTLQDYNIIDQKHLLKLVCFVNQSAQQPKIQPVISTEFVLIEKEEKDSLNELENMIQHYSVQLKKISNIKTKTSAIQKALIEKIKQNSSSLIEFIKKREKDLISVVNDMCQKKNQQQNVLEQKVKSEQKVVNSLKDFFVTNIIQQKGVSKENIVSNVVKNELSKLQFGNPAFSKIRLSAKIKFDEEIIRNSIVKNWRCPDSEEYTFVLKNKRKRIENIDEETKHDLHKFKNFFLSSFDCKLEQNHK